MAGMEEQRQRRISFAWRAAIWVTLIAVLAVTGLYFLQRWHRRAAHEAATETVAERGQWLTMSLALRAAEMAEAGSWREFSGLLKSLREVEGDLEFVSVQRGDLTLFQEHAGEAGISDPDHNYRFQGPVSIRRQRLTAGGEEIPVVTFGVVVTNPAGESVSLELGMRRRAVAREEWPAISAIDSMYRLSLATMVACFGICLALVFNMARREERQERERRKEEHLAFSGVLANGIVHDFRNPMSSLRLDAQMLEKEGQRGEDARRERMAELAGRMRHTLDRMEKVFQEFLVLAKPGQEAAERIELGDCAQDCLDMLVPRFEAAGVSSELCSVEGGAYIMASEASINRALLNVILNATQHAGSGGRVTVRVTRIKDRLRLEVCDTGPGIAKELRERVFDMFYTTRPQGTGLGLFLARTAIEKNGGTLKVAEPDGVGTRLRMEFPEANKEAE